MTSTLRIFKKHPNAIIPKRQTAGSLGYDLHAIEDIFVGCGTVVPVRTGLVIEPPPGLAIELRARSGLAARGLVLANGVGTVDPDYCGPNDEVKLLLGNISLSGISLKAGDRIAQFVLVTAAPLYEIEECPVAPAALSRGGLGSTGLRDELQAAQVDADRLAAGGRPEAVLAPSSSSTELHEEFVRFNRNKDRLAMVPDRTRITQLYRLVNMLLEALL